jgi:ketosteroid isomerase-like protein
MSSPPKELSMSNVDTVRAVFDAYLEQDRNTMDRLLADEFVFTSPQDDHIDKGTFFERCFPTADRLTTQEMLSSCRRETTTFSPCTSTS